MDITVQGIESLTDSQLAAWDRLQRDSETFDSPYFRPEFAQAVARVRANVEVAVLVEAGECVGFFPFERCGRVGRPLGSRLSDYQGVICRPGVHVAPEQLVRGCRLGALDFDHFLASQSEFRPYFHFTDQSPVLDLSAGFHGYCARRAALGDAQLKVVQRKARKLTREVGPLRLVARATDAQLLHQLRLWKSQQYQRTQITDVFAFPWTVTLLEDLLRIEDDACSGMLSVLYAGDRAVAMHMGMRSFGVLHYWFPTYDMAFAKYSPGYVLLLELARFCEPLGLRKIDMGRGRTDFKTDMMTGMTEVGIGTVDLRPVRRRVREQWRRTQDWIRNSPLRPAARIPGRVLYRCREWASFR